MTANPTNTCSHLMVGEDTHPTPYADMMQRQIDLQARLNKLPDPECNLGDIAYSVIYWRHCIHTECDELLEWYGEDDADYLELEMEVIDVLHFVFNIGIALFITAEEVQEAMEGISLPEPVPCHLQASPSHAQHGILRLSMALTKLIDLLPWKSWKNYSNYSADKDYIKKAYARVVYQTMLLACAVGLDLNRAYNVYCAKNKENHARQDRGY